MAETPEFDYMEGLLGRLPAVNPRDRDFPLAAIMQEPIGNVVLPSFKHWNAPPALDQAKTYSCVGHGVHQHLKCSPIRNIKNIPDPILIYNEAQLIDEWKGEDPHVQGTSLRAGVKVIQRLGYVESYHWCWDVETANRYLLTTGPLLLGLGWTTGMFKPNAKGFIYPTGQMAGGHCVLAIGINLTAKTPDGRKGFISILNHWGLKWGRNGRANMVLEDFAALLTDGGEAVAVREILKKVEATA